MSELYPFQRAGADWLKANRRGILGDGMGLGKTVQAAVAVGELGAPDVRIYCPAVARGVWRRELALWAPNVEARIWSYDGLKWDPTATEGSPDVLILDEGQYLKSREAGRTKRAYGRLMKDGPAQRAGYVWPLSGTIVPNHAGELWTHFKALFGETMSYHEWLKRYCNFYPTKYGPRVTGNRKAMLPELREKLGRVMLRRKAEDVLPELPPIVWGEMLLDPDMLEGARLLLDFEADVMAQSELAKIYARTGDMDLAIAEASPQISVLRRETGRMKASVVAKAVAAELADGAMDKVVLFAVHHDVLDTMAGMLADFGVVQLDGRTSDKQRNKNVHAFQTDPTKRVFVGQVQACGTAITLHAANQEVFVEQSWVSGENAQAAMRCLRIGQTRPVFVRTASVAGTLDESIDRVLARKAQMISELY